MLKKSLTVILSLILIAMLVAGCSNKDSGEDVTSGAVQDQEQAAQESALTGTTNDILLQLLDDAEASFGGDHPIPSTFIDPVSSLSAPGTLGMNPDDFVSLTEEATVAIGAMSAIAFQVVVVKAKNSSDAETVSSMIQKGFDSGKWISVFPEQSFTMVSGSYVLLAVGSIEQTEAIAAAFKDAAGGVATDPNVFYAGELGGSGGEPIPVEG